MPTIRVNCASLHRSLNKNYTVAEFEVLCFEVGIELDGIEDEGSESKSQGSLTALYRIDIPANRYDLLCIEGLRRALRFFLKLDVAPIHFRKISTEHNVEIRVHPSVTSVRQFVVGAVLRNITFDKARYDSFIELQEKLHQNICRKRSLVSIGTHDLDTVQGPFLYSAVVPESINFVPLTESGRGLKSFNGRELINLYLNDVTFKHLRPYAQLIDSCPLFPVITDANGSVLSLPPVINSDRSKINLSTRNVLIEVTATDLTKANIVLDTIVTSFSEYCDLSCTCECVNVVNDDDDCSCCPQLSNHAFSVNYSEINGLIGIDIPVDIIPDLCSRMQLIPSSSSSSGLTVTAPPNRSDIIHAVDVIEDIAIAYGYNNIPHVESSTLSVGSPLPRNHLCDQLRMEISRLGYIEVLTHALCSRKENYDDLRRTNDNLAVSLLNPVNEEYQVIRTSLIPGLLKTFRHNRSLTFKEGIKLFEISDVVIKASSSSLSSSSDSLFAKVTGTVSAAMTCKSVEACSSVDVGAVNIRRFIAGFSSPNAGFEIIHGLVDKVMRLLQIPPKADYALNSMSTSDYSMLMRVSRSDVSYFIQSANGMYHHHH